MSQNSTISEATPDSVWAILRELTARQVENERSLKEMFSETKDLIAANALQMAVTDRHISRLEKQIGGISNSYGSFAEEYFYNSLDRGDKIFFNLKT